MYWFIICFFDFLMYFYLKIRFFLYGIVGNMYYFKEFFVKKDLIV